MPTIPSVFVFAATCLMVLTATTADAQTIPPSPSQQAAESSAAGERVIVARIFDHEIHADELVIEGEEEHLRKTMEPEDFQRWQRTHRVSSLWTKVYSRALKHWADENGVVVPEPQVEQLAKRMLDIGAQRSEQSDNAQADAEKAAAMTTLFARAIVTDRTIARALHEKYGGRVAFGSLGSSIAVEGTEAVLRQLAEAGDLVILDEPLNKEFWQWASEPHGDQVRDGKEATQFFDMLEADPPAK